MNRVGWDCILNQSPIRFLFVDIGIGADPAITTLRFSFLLKQRCTDVVGVDRAVLPGFLEASIEAKRPIGIVYVMVSQPPDRL